MRLAVDRDLALLHRLEKRGLGLRAGPVDLVRQQDLREDRPRTELELVDLLVEGADARHVGGQQVGGELDPPEGAVERAGQGLGEHRLADARYVLDQEVPFAKQCDEAKPDLIFFVDDRPADVRHERIGDPFDSFRCPHSRDYRFAVLELHQT